MSRCLIFALLAACAAQPRARPEDMSAAAHRAEAARERVEAREHLENRGRGADALDDGLPGGLGGTPAAGMSLRGRVLHPDGAHRELFAAEMHREHAKQHEEAAAELERFEAAECRDIVVEERAACPLLIGAGALAEVEDGVEIRFRAGSPVDDVERRMRCHLAFA